MNGRPVCAGCTLPVGDTFFRLDGGEPACCACMTLVKLGMHPKLVLQKPVVPPDDDPQEAVA